MSDYDANGIDDFSINGVTLHLGRTSCSLPLSGRNYYWLGVTHLGVTHHIDIVSKRRQMRARPRR